MWTSMWYSSILAILMADMRTGALQNKELSARQCYQCPNANTTCNQQKASISCTAEKPYCGTTAVSPHYVSTLTCLPSSKNQCLIEFNIKSAVELSCVCNGDYCNAPFSKKVQNKLLLFTKTNTINNSSDHTDAFLKYLNIDNVTDVYKSLTDEADETNMTLAPKDPTLSTFLKLTDIPLAGNHTTDVEEPHAEALKHEATVPPDDDEDESEGSGAYDDTKTQKNHASAPAVPSAYLPAEENKASRESNVSFTLICLIIYATLQTCT